MSSQPFDPKAKYSNLSDGVRAILEAVLAVAPDLSEEELAEIMKIILADESKDVPVQIQVPKRPDQNKN